MSKKDLRIFKVDKNDSIIFNQNYIVINSAMLVHRDFIKLNNIDLQIRIDQNQPFNKMNNDYIEALPNLNQIIPRYCSDYTGLKALNLMCNRFKSIDVFLLNELNNYILTIDKRYLDFLANIQLITNTELTSKDKHSPITLFDCNKDLIALCMPTGAKHALNDFYLYSYEAKSELSKNEDLEPFMIKM